MQFGTRTGFGLEFHLGRDPYLLCVDLFLGGLHLNARDNAFYPPLLVKKLKDELHRFRTPAPPPTGFASPAEAFRVAEDWTLDDPATGPAPEDGEEFASHRFLEWGGCTDDVLAFAFPYGDDLHLACRVHGDTGPRPSALVAVSRTALTGTLEESLAAAEHAWSLRR
ncbi:hypothetical protein [Streptomyces sp. 4F14]|uniref:hypothetical protein n=1 Tax=Streptomyces sp. 4F14 TaxID=3394380 RepID=UPI003A853102